MSGSSSPRSLLLIVLRLGVLLFHVHGLLCNMLRLGRKSSRGILSRPWPPPLGRDGSMRVPPLTVQWSLSPSRRSFGAISAVPLLSLCHVPCRSPTTMATTIIVGGQHPSRLLSTLSPQQVDDSTAADDDVVDPNHGDGHAVNDTLIGAGGHVHVNGHALEAATVPDSTFPDDIVIHSQPMPGGNWNVHDPLGWSRHFGRRSAAQTTILHRLACLSPDDDGYFAVRDNHYNPTVTIVRNKLDAQRVLARLHGADPDRTLFACDTEVMGIDLKSVGPVGNGYVTCVSMYAGPEFDFGLGQGPGTSLWIDNLDDAFGVLQEFKAWFENPRFKKVWHNYGFDRHVLWNEGIDVQGFGGDTMHMARLENTSRQKSATNANGQGYSLEALTEELTGERKKPMKELFGLPRLRQDGSEGTLIDIPPVEVLQRDPKHRPAWIEYSTFDAQGTWCIREELQKRLEAKEWMVKDGVKYNLYHYYWQHMRYFGEVLTDMERRGIRVDAHEYLAKVEQQAREDRRYHSKIFREWAQTKIGPAGLALNPASSTQLQTFLFGGAMNTKVKEPTETSRTFRVPRDEIEKDALEAFKTHDEEVKTKAPGDKEALDVDILDRMKAAQLKALCKEQGLKVSGKKSELQERLRQHFLSPPDPPAQPDDVDSMTDEDIGDALIGRGLLCAGSSKEMRERLREDMKLCGELLEEDRANGENFLTIAEALNAAAQNGGVAAECLNQVKEKAEAVPKWMDITIRSLGLEPEKYTTGGAPSVTADVIKRLAGDPFSDPPLYGTALDKFGKDGCEALYSLSAIGSIDTMIANFLTSLQELADEESRVHCSLNLNTETGRLSSRRPNLQNQPALEKDKYKIRKAFQASPGNNLIVADYGQLELRIMASIATCKAMIDAFESGGDFHSRTALDMFDYIRTAVENGDVLLEWDYAHGDPPKPLLKDRFASERRKAKVLNFSLLYGKTAHGLSKDWGITTAEAESMLQKWYDARPEVRDWQVETKKTARQEGWTRTLMGRYRDLPEAMARDRRFLGHAERASINTPIQGGAADIAMMAMNKINRDEKLKRLGWILLLQVHDELILEGPEETAAEAFAVVKTCMEAPWAFGLDPTAVPLLVDGSYNQKTWYDAK